MSLRDDLTALADAALNEEKLDGTADAAEQLKPLTTACEERARAGQRSVAYPEPKDDAPFLSKGAAYRLQEILQSEGLKVGVIPYKSVYFYLDIHW